jgi:hypothetical protein
MASHFAPNHERITAEPRCVHAFRYALKAIREAMADGGLSVSVKTVLNGHCRTPSNRLASRWRVASSAAIK